MMRSSRRNSTLVLPGPAGEWEVWFTNGPAGPERGESLARPRDLRGVRGALYLGVPGSCCRTLALRLPRAEPARLRSMVFAQLEKRGLTARQGRETVFEPHPVTEAEGEVVVSVDVLTEALPAEFLLLGATAYAASARLLPLPEQEAVVWREDGRLVLAVGRNGRLVHTCVLSPQGHLTAEAGRESELTLMTLAEEGVIAEGCGLRLWGPFPEEEVELWRSGWRGPLEREDRPAPVCPGAGEVGAGSLLPAVVRQSRRRRRGQRLQAAAALVAALVYGWALWRFHEREEGLDARMAALEVEVGPTREAAERVRSSGERWKALRDVLEPRRYPLVHLSHVARVMPEGGVVLRDFESKVSDVILLGEARAAGEAFDFLRRLNAEEELRVYAWSMPEPKVDEDGTATFEIKGTLR